jgi:very-short-patch-repair endonuclease
MATSSNAPTASGSRVVRRTAFDLARWLGPRDLLSVIEQAMHDGGHDETEMYAVAIDWLSPRRPWAGHYVRQLGLRLPGRAAESHPEIRVSEALRQAGIHGLVRQYPIELPGYGRARFDLAVPQSRWALEVDVFPTHSETMGQLADTARDDAARSIGWTTFRIGRADYCQNFDASIADAAASCRRARAINAPQR